MDVKIKVEAVIRNFGEPSDLKRLDMDLHEFVNYMLDEEGFISMVDFETIKLVGVKFCKEEK